MISRFPLWCPRVWVFNLPILCPVIYWCVHCNLICFCRCRLQKRHTEEERSLGDRRRRFLDTELAQDTEGISAWFTLSGVDVSKRSSSPVNLLRVCLSELFQDLIQLQEIWIAEGKKTKGVKKKKQSKHLFKNSSYKSYLPLIRPNVLTIFGSAFSKFLIILSSAVWQLRFLMTSSLSQISSPITVSNYFSSRIYRCHPQLHKKHFLKTTVIYYANVYFGWEPYVQIIFAYITELDFCV